MKGGFRSPPEPVSVSNHDVMVRESADMRRAFSEWYAVRQLQGPVPESEVRDWFRIVRRSRGMGETDAA